MKSKHYKRWLLQAPLGLMLTGFGACLIAEAAMQKYSGQPWFLYGTAALCVFNSGLCVFGDAILHRMRFERLE